MFDHLGVHPDWNAVYLEGEDQIDMICQALEIAEEPSFYPLRKSDPSIREALISATTQEISVSSIAGCCQTFRRSLVDEIGPLCDGFNPYGFEDVDFCIRALKHGYRNFTDPAGFLLHGTDTRHADRTRPGQVSRQERNRTRCLTLLAHRHAPQRYEELIKKRILARCMFRKARGLSIKDSLYAMLVGFGTGQQQIREGLAPPVELSNART